MFLVFDSLSLCRTRVQYKHRAIAEARLTATPTTTAAATQVPAKDTTQLFVTPRPAHVITTAQSLSSAYSSQPSSLPASPSTSTNSGVDIHDSETTTTIGNDLLAKKLKQLQVSTLSRGPESKANEKNGINGKSPNFLLFHKLLSHRDKYVTISASSSAVERSIRQAPLLAAEVVSEHYEDLVPQYGLIGSFRDGGSDSQLFLNTNVPFSAFICGVQGSGKSHTTSCILENAVLASPNIGYLESPVSALVFSYGEWSSGGVGFNISEAAFLGASHSDFPRHHVKQITVLYSPSNAAIKRLYERLPNIKMVPFRLAAHNLDISALHTLMAVDEKSTMPLYMATVEAILRGIASESEDGSLNYLEFKRRLAKEKFDPTQTIMLKMRMNLLESFLDLTGSAPAPTFNSGEITIIDLSDPFLTPSTACILFKLGLEQFLQSPAAGKMVVLDEAHKVHRTPLLELSPTNPPKYMHDTPGSKILTDYLTRVIRLQRHQGARIVISTQEPTIATELIALCSVTIMHRFTSPTWYAALRRHIHAVDDDKAVMQRIESLETGEALVYAPSAVLGFDGGGGVVRATGRLLKVDVRKRVTLDGGASIMAV